MSRFRSTSLGACVLFAVTPAWAGPDAGPPRAPPPATLHYETPSGEGCPDRTSFENLVAARLGYSPFEPSALREVSVSIALETDALLATIRLTEDSTLVGERELRASAGECESLATAVATAVSIALDPRSATGPMPPPAPAEPKPKPAASEPEAPPEPPAPPPSSPEKESVLRFVAELSGIGGLGITPGPSLGGMARIGVRTDIWSVGAEGRVETTLGAVSLDSGDRVSAVAMSAGLVPCAHLDPAFGCLAVYVGAFQGQGESVENPRIQSTVTSALAARAGVGWPVIEAIHLRAHVEVGVPLVRTELLIEDQAVWDASPLYASAGVGVATLLP